MPINIDSNDPNIVFMNRLIDALALNKVAPSDIFASLLTALEAYHYELADLPAFIKQKKNEWRMQDSIRKDNEANKHLLVQSVSKAIAIKASKKTTNYVKKFTLGYLPSLSAEDDGALKTVWTMGKNFMRVLTKNASDNTWKLWTQYVKGKEKSSANELAQTIKPHSEDDYGAPPKQDLQQSFAEPVDVSDEVLDTKQQAIFKDFVKLFISQLEQKKVDKDIITQSLVSCMIMNHSFSLADLQAYQQQPAERNETSGRLELVKQTAYHTIIPAVGKTMKYTLPKALEYISAPVVGPSAFYVGMVADILFEVGVDQIELMVKHRHEKAQTLFNQSLDDKFDAIYKVRLISSSPQPLIWSGNDDLGLDRKRKARRAIELPDEPESSDNSEDERRKKKRDASPVRKTNELRL